MVRGIEGYAMIKSEPKTITTESVTVGRKRFTAELCENDWGQFLRLSEDVGGRMNRIVIPTDGLADVCGLIERVAIANRQERS